ncbi:hypothetical protein [Nocardia wallacei]|uniref:hypothetical protein n=1 Tax=Nocardia wallacei TaxID=480035 RepID=UPI002453A07D|nr:hypothetical protein [Nocardia wallacei]
MLSIAEACVLLTFLLDCDLGNIIRVSDEMLPDQAHPVLMAHNAPPPGRTWTVAEAHAVWQVHKECAATGCPALRHAKYVLVQANRMIPADAPHIGS